MGDGGDFGVRDYAVAEKAKTQWIVSNDAV